MHLNMQGKRRKMLQKAQNMLFKINVSKVFMDVLANKSPRITVILLS